MCVPISMDCALLMSVTNWPFWCCTCLWSLPSPTCPSPPFSFFLKYFLWVYYVLNIIVGAGDTAEKRTVFVPKGLTY